MARRSLAFSPTSLSPLATSPALENGKSVPNRMCDKGTSFSIVGQGYGPYKFAVS